MRRKLGVMMIVVAVASLSLAAERARPANPYATKAVFLSGGERPLMLLTYNVEGLPWPLGYDRTSDLRLIGRDLQLSRSKTGGPQVVALQEAFAADAKEIGKQAGFAHAAFGPDTADVGNERPTMADRLFAAGASFLSGETGGKRLDSGLAIFSDYPILWTRRIAFPGFACAGWDCLANKGIVAAALKVPGSPNPVVIIDTHLNSRAASGVPDIRSNHAYRRQMEMLSAFLSRLENARLPFILSGDFNVGRDPARTSAFKEMVRGRRLSIAVAEEDCGRECRLFAPADRGAFPGTGKAMILYGPDARLSPSTTAPFGRETNGTLLSDHLGLAARFALTRG